MRNDLIFVEYMFIYKCELVLYKTRSQAYYCIKYFLRIKGSGYFLYMIDCYVCI